MRAIPKEAPPQIAQSARMDDVRTYQFLTPVFGGGVAVKESDPVTPMRIASIRGQLRFWWRAVNLRGCSTVRELRRAEEAVFGSTDKASPLIIRVNKSPGKPASLAVLEGKFGVRPGMEAIAYGAFPLRDKDPNSHGVLHNFGEQRFELGFAYPKAIEDDVHAALWAWAHFGGLGGRTRRGFGAIAQTSPAFPTIDEGWTRFVKTPPVLWPYLNEKPVIALARNGANDGMEALERLLGALRRLRQGPNVGRRAGQGAAPGRSFWPEPDAIRLALRDQVGGRHGTAVTDHNCFPRAEFGTPIIFHFKDGGKGDPKDTTLQPNGHGRLASRLILRPHLGTGDQIEAMAIVLAHPLPISGYILVQDGRELPVSVQLKEPLSLGDNRAFTDPIKRFLEELRK
jgi:CRISPR-associated protein Cmr1